jgi:hypothetical protein
MIRLPFSRRSKDEEEQPPSAAFAGFCEAELERRRDADEALDERRFRAAMELVIRRLQAMEQENRP